MFIYGIYNKYIRYLVCRSGLTFNLEAESKMSYFRFKILLFDNSLIMNMYYTSVVNTLLECTIQKWKDNVLVEMYFLYFAECQ